MILKPDSFWKPKAPHRHVAVCSGRLWVTRAGDPADVILEAGDTLELKGRGWLGQAIGGIPCDFTTSTFSPTRPTQAIPSRSSSKKAG